MDACGIKSQAEMARLAGWSKATMSQLYNQQQDLSTPILEAASEALKVEPFELLMPPERAMALRKFRETAAIIVGETDAVPKEREQRDTRKTGTG
jgi:transcriptional regulator with XRE-family HTH domain